MLMRVPLITGAILFSLPWTVKLPGVRALLLGLFDITPASTIAVTLAATSVAGIVADNSRVIYLHSFARGMGGLPYEPHHVRWFVWFGLTVCLSLPVIVYAIKFPNDQNPGDLGRRIWYAIGTLLFELAAQWGFVIAFRWLALTFDWAGKRDLPSFLKGYSPPQDHIAAAAGFTLALLVYIALGLYGSRCLGKKNTVPALCSALMVMMLACSTFSALSFFLDLWHVPLLLAVIGWGVFTAQSRNSDHFYTLWSRPGGVKLPPAPLETLAATRTRNGRVIVAAANGGGIQAAAWAAQVLEGLGEDSPSFAGSLRLISSVSGGSLGSACYTYKQANPEARSAFLAASASSLDEVAWGLSWPDLMKSVFPWGPHLIGRGRALEKAWIANCGTGENPTSLLDQPLSDWNAEVWKGNLPAVIMNATLVETGQRLLMGTTQFTENNNYRARVDASKLHGYDKDVAAVTAARLSASFPYVTPAARSTAPGLQPHVVDGGYYDNYGMSTLVEWLDEALCQDQLAATRTVSSVLVIQIHGAPVTADSNPKANKLSDRGWFFQMLAPLLTLDHVRGAGQIAHNDLELGQLQQRWFGAVPIHSVTLEFPDQNAPLSWHLTRQQKERVLDRWMNCQAVLRGRGQVSSFLRGSDRIDCDCPTCNQRAPLNQVATA
jgi:hypothetical protein